MKSKMLLFIIILAFKVSFSQWELRYPDIPSDQINDVIFLNESTGFIVNSGGSVLMTTDGGSTWKIKAHYQRNIFSEIKFIDNQNGFAISPYSYIGDDVSFIFTTDGGLHWDKGSAYMGDALTFIPLSRSVVLKSSIYEGVIYRLDNFFGDWNEMYRMPHFFDIDVGVSYGDILQFQRLPNGRILALGSSWHAKNAGVISDSVSFILKSDDLGETWDTLWCGLPYSSQTFSFYNDSVGWLGAELDRIYKTTDGGASWVLQYSDSVQGFPIKSVSSPDGLNVYAADGNGRVIYSANGGIDWDFVQVGQSYDYPFKIKFTSPMRGFLAGYDSTSYDFWSTTNGGVNWERVSKSVKGNIRKLDFVNENIGMGVGDNFIYKTLDGGYSWQVIYDSPLEYFSGLDMLDSLNAWAVGNSLYKTTDGGNTWSPVPLIAAGEGVVFYDNFVGILYDPYTCNVTTDGGISWKDYPINNGQLVSSFNKMKFTDPGHLWFANQYGVWLSKDTAKTWKLFEIDGSYTAFDFADSLYGWLSIWGGQFKEMVCTTDGGSTWTTIDKPYSFQPEDVLIYNNGSFNILVAGYEGSLLRFRQWDNFVYDNPTYTGKPLHSFASYKKDNLLHIWVAGDGMTVLHYLTSITNIEEKMNQGILSFSLSQNYPNPFNPSTKIRYAVGSPANGTGRQFVTLVVYDMLGREVSTLVNDEKVAGEYEVEFNGANLSSGIYFYQLKAGSFIQVKKLVLLK
ncbi:MAG TPA: YCF48-related protein [Ignavibacteriaceae bacterium]|nr:YCF48-related protein [Ignavibacteriaceae bacterium]